MVDKYASMSSSLVMLAAVRIKLNVNAKGSPQSFSFALTKWSALNLVASSFLLGVWERAHASAPRTLAQRIPKWL
jgi:hypothetical protein